MKNVGSDYQYCSGCGLCESICPTNAIEVRLVKEGVLRPIVSDSCVDCGMCLKYCPGRNLEKFSYRAFSNYFYGHTNNRELRYEAASGGLTTELLAYLLDEKCVDYVVTADENHCIGMIEGCIINEKKSLFLKSGSNYCPVNIGKTIKEIKQKEGTCAIVCLPCLARGIRRLMRNDNQLKEKIKYVLCLLCNHVPTYNATEYMIKKHKLKRPDLVKYRGNGWFGKFRAFELQRRKDYTEYFSSNYSEYFSSNFAECFWQEACIKCNDHFGKYSDICFGDADFVKYRESEKENIGETICFVQNEEIVRAMKKMGESNIISLFSDISVHDLDWIYGPLCEDNRADKSNLNNNVKRIIANEKKIVRVNKLKKNKAIIREYVAAVKRKMLKGKKHE